MTIRNMTSGDYGKAYELWIKTKGMGLNNLDDSYEGISRFLERNPKTCFMAEENDEIVGAIIAGHDGRRGYIYHTAVAEKCRHQGIGTRLVENALLWFLTEMRAEINSGKLLDFPKETTWFTVIRK